MSAQKFSWRSGRPSGAEGGATTDEEPTLLRGAKGTMRTQQTVRSTRLCYQSREADSGRLGLELTSRESQLLFAVHEVNDVTSPLQS